MNNFKIILKIIISISFLHLQSCGLKIVENHGQIYEQDVDFDNLKVGKITKKEVVNMLGSPSTTSNFDGEQSWFYISSEFKKFVFLDGENTDQKILLLSFNNEVLNDKEILSKKDINKIEYEETVTESKSKKLNFIREFFRNLNPTGSNQSSERPD